MIEMTGARNMSLGKLFRRPHVNEGKVGSAKLLLQLRRSCEQLRARVFFFHRLRIALLEMALQITTPKNELRPVRRLLAALFACLLLVYGFTYQLALPGRKLLFPADHYSHPGFKTEWWYYTGHLESERGQKYGYQVTFFRFGLRDRQQNEPEERPILFSELYMAHFALSDVNKKTFFFRERINRGYADKAGAATDRYLVWNEDWKVEGNEKTHAIQVN